MVELKKDAKNVGHKIKKVVEYVGDAIKENTELAEHETDINNVKTDAKSVYQKVKEAL